MKKTLALTILGLILVSSFSTLHANLVVENPYNHVSVKPDYKMKLSSNGKDFYHTLMEHTTGGSYYFQDIDIPFDRIDVSIIVNHPTTNAIVASITWVYSPNEAKFPPNTQFEDSFTFNNKKGKIVYTIDYTFAAKAGGQGVSSLKVNILHAELNGVELSKRGVPYKTGSQPEL